MDEQIFYDEQTFYNKHYIKVDSFNRVVDAWSDGPHPEKDITSAICINEQAGYQFCIDGEENPVLYDTEYNIPLYKYEDNEVVKRTNGEIEADKAKISKPMVIAPRNILVGEYVTVNGVMYKATANIPNGGAIVTGQNTEETTVEAQLYELMKKGE